MLFWTALIIGATLFVAYANGANDNFKGVANGQAQWSVIRTILLPWVLTLPAAALSAGVIYAILLNVTVS